MSHNLAARDNDGRNGINVDLAAAGVAYRERLYLTVIQRKVEMQQLESLHENFRERLQHYH